MRILDDMFFGSAAAVSTTPAPRNRVLIIDDDEEVRSVYQELLVAANFDVVTASGGAEGLTMLRRDPTIGLVLLDLMMPEMDGWRFRHAQRSDARLDKIPTVIVSGTPLRDIVHAELEAADYLLKPVGREHLISVVAAYCKPRNA